MRFKPLLLLLIIVSGIQATPQIARAENIYDPLPPLNWDEMKGCELVVAARFEIHETGISLRDDPDVKSGLTHDHQQTLTLHVDRVLKGKGIKAGDSVKAELRHWYSIETYPVDDFTRIPAKSDGIPRLCYKYQPSNPGGLVPLKIVPNIYEDAVYFFPHADTPTLERNGQVQPREMEKGWMLALHGYTPSLPFRLAQNASQKVHQDALEELDALRDPATLDVLFDWLSASPQESSRNFAFVAESALKAIGDHNGDVYNRALKRLSTIPRNWIPYSSMTSAERQRYYQEQARGEGQGAQDLAYFKYADIMAEVDGDRAAHDFNRMISHGPPALTATAGEALGFTYSEYALSVAFRLLKNSRTASIGAWALENLLRPEYSSERSPRSRTKQTTRLLALAQPHLADALHLSVFDASRTAAARDYKASDELRQMRLARESLEALLPQTNPPLVNLSHAEQVLLHPHIDPKKLITSSFQSDWTPVEKEGVATLVAIDNEHDPRFIPLLVTLMKNASPWLKRQGGYDAVFHYPRMFPHAFKSELDKQGLTASVLETSLREGFPDSPGSLLNRPNAVWSLDKYDNSDFGVRSLDDGYSLEAQRYKSSPVLLRALTDFVAYTLDQSYITADLDSLHLLVLADPIAAWPLIDRALAKTNLGDYATRGRYLALGVAAGHNELLDELLSAYPVSDYDPSNHKAMRGDWPGPKVLLWANNPRAFERYLQIVDVGLNDTPSDIPNSFRRYPLYARPNSMIQALFAQHPREFFDRVLRLLRSSVPSRRVEGDMLLESALYWDADFDPNALTRERTAQLKTIAPLIERLASLPEEPMRVALLQHFGVNLPKDSQKRQTTLRQLLSNSNPTVARNALRLLELQTGDYYVDFLWYCPASQRERLWNAMVADHALAEKDIPTPLRVGL